MEQNTQRNPEQIANAAYRLWEQAGRPTGRDMEFWLKAEKQVAAPPKPAANPASLRPRSQPAAPAKQNTAVELKSRQPIPDAGKHATTPASQIVPPREKRPAPSAVARAR